MAIAPPRNQRAPAAAMDALDALTLADAVWLARTMDQRDMADKQYWTDLKAAQDKYRVLGSEGESPAPGAAPEAAAQADQHEGEHEHEDEHQNDPSAPADLAPVRPPMPGPSQHGAGARVGALRTLAGAQEFAAAMRTFRTTPRRATGALDEAATVDQFARCGQSHLVPVLQRGARRWLRLSLVVEAAPTNALWSQPIGELELVARAQGAFRQVRRWELRAGEQGGLLPIGRNGRFGRTHRTLSSVPFWRDEIVIIVSDFTSASWWDGAFTAALQRVAASQPLVLMHTLPQRLWNRSWAGQPDALAYAAAPACVTSSLQVSPIDPQAECDRLRQLAIPLIGMNAVSFGNWSAALMNVGTLKMPAIFLASRDAAPAAALDQPDPGGAALKPDLLIMTYNMASSALARRLAKFLAITAPLTFPVMRWIQKAMLPESDASHLAEFVLGGLLQQVAGDATTAPDDVVYDFIAGVRETLQEGIPINHAIEVLQTVGACLEANQAGTLDARTGIATWPDQNIDALAPDLRAFALVSRNFLTRIGLGGPAAGARPTAKAPKTPLIPPPPKRLPYDIKAAEHARVFKRPIIDMQWSPAEEGLLAILHEGGVELWDVLHNEHSLLIGSADIDTAPTQALTIYWYSGSLGYSQRSSLAAIRPILASLAEGLAAAGFPVHGLTQIHSLAKLPKRQGTPSEYGVLLVFESESLATASDGNMDELDGHLATAMPSFIATGAIRLSVSAPSMRHIAMRADLSRFSEPAPHGASRRSFAAALGQFVQTLSEYLMSSKVMASRRRSGATAICWLHGSLVIAEAHGNDCTINQLDARKVVRKGTGTVSSKHLLHLSGTPHLRQLIGLPTAMRAAVATAQARVVHDKPVPLAWVDHQGTLSIHGQVRAAGNGLPRLLAGTGTSSVAVTNHGLGLNIIAPMAESTGSRPVDLLPHKPRNAMGTDALAFFAHERIIAASVQADTVLAVTSAGFLHAGRLPGQAFKSIEPERPCLDPHPVNLKGAVAGACFTPDGMVVCIVRPNGMLECWDTRTGSRLDRLALPPARRQPFKPVLALSGDQQLLASSDGRALKIFRIVDERGGVFARPTDRPDNHVLWVDDRPNNNIRERRDFKKLGIRFTLARTTDGALKLLERYRFAAVISDMGRKEGPREGYVLLEALRGRSNHTPLFFFAGSDSQEHRDEALARGAQGSTNMSRDLIDMVMRAVHEGTA